jgi:hypothetical protein
VNGETTVARTRNSGRPNDGADELEQQELIAAVPPTWEQLAYAFELFAQKCGEVDQLAAQLKQAKAEKEEASLNLTALGRRIRRRRLNAVTGEVLYTPQTPQ